MKSIVKCILTLCSTMTVLSGCNSNNTGNSQQYLTVANSKITATHELQTITNPSTDNLTDVAKGNGTYVVVGEHGTILTSKDGYKWESQKGITSINLNAIDYNPTKKLFYAIGDAGVILSSPDGLIWDQYQTLTPPANLKSIMNVKGDEIIGAESETLFEIALASKRGLITTRSTNGNVTSLAYNGIDAMVAGTDNGNFYLKAYSAFASANWTQITTLADTVIADIKYDAGDSQFVAATVAGEVVSSALGKIWSNPIKVDNKQLGLKLNSIAMKPSGEIYDDFFVVGSNSAQQTLAKSSQDFNKWDDENLPTTNQLTKVTCFDASDCVIVGNQNTIIYGKLDTSSSRMIWKNTNDTVAPTVSIISPSNNAQDENIDTTIEIKFSKPIFNLNTSNVILHLGGATGPAVALNTIIAESNNSYKLKPANELQLNTKYYLTFGDDIKDAAGNLLVKAQFSFTTVNISNTWGIAFSGNYAYITRVNSTGGYLQCAVTIDGLNSKSCFFVKVPTLSANNGFRASNITILGNYAYMTNIYRNSYYRCNIADNGLINPNSCIEEIPSGSGALTISYSVTINNNYAYFSNYQTENAFERGNYYTRCTVKNEIIESSSCTNIAAPAGTYVQGYGIAINNNYAIFDGRLQCKLSDSGLSNCNYLKAPSGIYGSIYSAYNGNYVYIIYYAAQSSGYGQCSLNSDGSINPASCSAYVPLVNESSNPSGIRTVNFNAGYAYFITYDARYTQCKVDSNGINSASCKTSNIGV